MVLNVQPPIGSPKRLQGYRWKPEPFVQRLVRAVASLLTWGLFSCALALNSWGQTIREDRFEHSDANRPNWLHWPDRFAVEPRTTQAPLPTQLLATAGPLPMDLASHAYANGIPVRTVPRNWMPTPRCPQCSTSRFRMETDDNGRSLRECLRIISNSTLSVLY